MTNQKATFNKIFYLLEKIVDNSSMIGSDKKHFSQIELDVILSDVRKLYDQYYTLGKLMSEEKNPDMSASNNDEKAIALDEKEEETSEKKSEGDDIFNQVNGDTEEQSSLHDKISSETEKKSIVHENAKETMRDIRKSIAINQKFFIMNELFDGNIYDYNNCIEDLNSLHSWAECKDFLKKSAKKNNWKDDSQALNQLTTLVKQKFSEESSK